MQKKSKLRKLRKTAELEQKAVEDENSDDKPKNEEDDVPSASDQNSRHVNSATGKAGNQSSINTSQKTAGAYGKTHVKTQPTSEQPRPTSVKVHSRKTAFESDKVHVPFDANYLGVLGLSMTPHPLLPNFIIFSLK